VTPAAGRVTVRGEQASVADAVVRSFGGRYSSELGIEVDAGDDEVERWFLAATLFGTRISARIAERTFDQLTRAGIARITDARDREWADLVELLDAGGYTRYDFRTATRLQALAVAVDTRFGGAVAAIGSGCADPSELTASLDALPGWGPVTIHLFLRELRGVWPGARIPLDPNASAMAAHLGWLTGRHPDDLTVVRSVAAEAGLDARDVESGLVRLALAHRRVRDCPGGTRCVLLRPPERWGRDRRADDVGTPDPVGAAGRRPGCPTVSAD